MATEQDPVARMKTNILTTVLGSCLEAGTLVDVPELTSGHSGDQTKLHDWDSQDRPHQRLACSLSWTPEEADRVIG